MKDIKDYRERELSLFIIANVLIFLIVHNIIEIDVKDLSDSMEVLSEIFASVILSMIAFGLIITTECLITSGLKEKMVYLFGFFGLLNLPGCTIFSKIKDKNSDSRFSYKNLTEKYPTLYTELPTDKKTRLRYENEKWYAIYNQIREVTMIHFSQRDWLLCRDIYISTLIMLGDYIVVTAIKFVEFNSYYLLFLVIILIITNLGANRKAVRFAYNVIAYDVNKL